MNVRNPEPSWIPSPNVVAHKSFVVFVMFRADHCPIERPDFSRLFGASTIPRCRRPDRPDRPGELLIFVSKRGINDKFGSPRLMSPA